MIHVVKIEQTCFGCPSQWDAHDREGHYYFIRYRHGHLSVRDDLETVFSKDFVYPDGSDGVMSTEDMFRLCEGFLQDERP